MKYEHHLPGSVQSVQTGCDPDASASSLLSGLICVTNRALCQENFLTRIERLAKAHPAAILLREKDLTEAEYTKLAREVLCICKKHGTLCILHNYADAARELHHTALHLPLPALRLLSDSERHSYQVLGASCHSVADAKEAEALGCSYITAGHIFDTDCKKGLPGRGLEFLRKVCSSVSIPVYAIGGICPENIAAVHAAGTTGACIMSSAMTCADADSYLASFSNHRQEHSMSLNTTRLQKEQLLLYAVTDRAWVGRQTLYEQVEDALKGGATIIQLREKELDENTFLQEARQLAALCHSYHVPLIINDNVQIALESGADGVHVGIEDAPVEQIRRQTPHDFIIGATAKTVAQAQADERAGADYLGVGAVFPSPTKQAAIRITNEQLKDICSSVSIPAVAIGGISLENVDQLAGGGMDGIAVVSAIFGAEDIQEAAKQLRRKIHTMIGENIQ